MHQDIALGVKSTDLRVAYAAQKSAETKIQCVFIGHSDAATKAGAMGPIASFLQQKMNTTRQGQALKNILLHDANLFLSWQSFRWSQIFPAFTDSKSSYHGVRNRLSLFLHRTRLVHSTPLKAYFSKNILPYPFIPSRSPSVDVLGPTFCRGLILLSSQYRTYAMSQAIRPQSPYGKFYLTTLLSIQTIRPDCTKRSGKGILW